MSKMLGADTRKGTACLKLRLSGAGGDGIKIREQNIRVKGLCNKESLPGGDECGAEPGQGQMCLGEEWLVIRKE